MSTNLSLSDRFRSVFRLERKSATSGTSSPEPWFLDLLGARPTSAGVTVTPRTAMECAAVHSAVTLISEAIGCLPLPIFKLAADGSKTPDTTHPVYPLLHDAANDWTSAEKFREEVTRDALLYRHGGFAEIARNNDGKPVNLIRIDPEISPVEIVWEDGEPQYSVAGKPIDRQNLLHIPSPSLHGRGLIAEGREEIGRIIVLEQHMARLFGNSARPSGIISFKGVPAPDALTRAKKNWQEAHGGNKSGGLAVIPSDATWQAVTLSSVDAQFLELLKHSIADICRLFRVPQHMLFEMDRATWANSEQMNREFLSYSLLAWIKRWESEISLKLFTPDERKIYAAKFQTDQFVRPDFLAQVEALSKAVAARILNPNEARAKIDMPPYVGGEQFVNPAIDKADATTVLNP
jgi:HK97 family phage portal protein